MYTVSINLSPARDPSQNPGQKLRRGLRSNLNTRGVHSREDFWFFGRSSLSHYVFLAQIGGNLPLSVPDLSKSNILRTNRGKTKMLRSKLSS